PQCIALCDQAMTIAPPSLLPLQIGLRPARLYLGALHGEPSTYEDRENESDEAARGSWSHPRLLYFRAALALLRGPFGEALSAAHECGNKLQSMNAPSPAYLPWMEIASVAAHRLGERPRARELAIEQLTLAQRSQVPRAVGIALRTLGAVENGKLHYLM